MTLGMFKKKICRVVCYFLIFIEYKYYINLDVILRNVNRFSRSRHSVVSPRKCRLPPCLNAGTSISVGDFEFRVPRSPSGAHFRFWSSRPEQAGSAGYTVTSERRRKLGRNRSAGVLRQDVVNAATLTHTEDDYRIQSFFTVMSRLIMQTGHAKRFLKMPVACYAAVLSVLYFIFT